MTLKVLLLAPYAGGEGLDREGKIFKERVFPAPALGVHHIAGHLRRHGIHCDVLDPNLQCPQLDHQLARENYDVIGFSLNHQTLENDLGLVHLVKRKSPRSLLLAGGIEATFNPHQVFGHSPIDIIVLGEGEAPVLEICRGTEWERIPGLYIRQGEGFRFTDHRPALTREEFSQSVLGLDFGRIPYPLYWSSLEARYDGQLSPRQLQEIRTLRLYTTNYCPYECAFCSATHFRSFVEGKKSRVVSLESEEVVWVLKKALQHHPETLTVFFADDDFILNSRRCQEICQGILAAKREGSLPAPLSFIANTRLNNLTPPLLSLMEEAGWRIVLCGVESFSPRLLVEYEKKYDIEAVHATLGHLLNTRIRPYLTIILFSPDCTLQDVELNVRECIRYALQGAGLGVYLYVMPLPGCRMVEREGMEIEYQEVPIPHTGLSLRKIRRLLPRDAAVRELLREMDRMLEEHQERLARRYGLVHISSRVYSLVFLSLLCQLLGLEELTPAMESLLSQGGHLSA